MHEHVTDQDLFLLLFSAEDGAEPQAKPRRDGALATVQAHVEGCASCQARYQDLRQLRLALQKLRTVQPRPAQRQKYIQLFSQVQQTPQNQNRLLPTLQEAVGALRLALRVDTRGMQPGFAVRNGSLHRFRLLYSAYQLDLELFLENEGAAWRLYGELLPGEEFPILPPILAQLQRKTESSLAGGEVWETELTSLLSDANGAAPLSNFRTLGGGRFQFESLPSGAYQLMLTPAKGPLLEVTDLTIP